MNVGKIMNIKVHEDYKKIDTENIKTLEKYGLSKDKENLYRCVICGEKACISNSMSYRGHRLMHTSCANKAFEPVNMIKAFRWIAEED